MTKSIAQAPRKASLDDVVAPDVVPADFIPCPSSAHALYHLDLEAYSGPLDLLLFLIRRHQIDIFDIPIAFICAHYLAAIDAMEDLNLDVAAEFMAMAAELLHIKSRLLLPKPESIDDNEEEEEDPRAELVRRLLEYQRFQAAAAELSELPRLGRDVFAREPEKLPNPAGPQLRETSIFALVHAFNGVLKRAKPEVRHQVVMEQVSVRKRMLLLIDSLANITSMGLAELLADVHERIDIIVTFLAILELTRMKLLRLHESDEGNIYLHPRFEGGDEAIASLEEHASDVDAQFAG